MKKSLLTILAFSMAALANAGISVDYKGANVPDGSVVELGKEVFNDLGGMYEIGEHFTITGATPMTISVSSDSKDFTYCTTQCYMLKGPDANGKYTHSSTITNSPQDLALDAYFYDPEIPAVDKSITFKLISDDEEMTFTVRLNTTGSAVKEMIHAAKSVTFKGNRLYLNSDNASGYAIYGISGKAVKSGNVQAHGSIDLSSLPAGIYLYKIGKTTGKVIVK